MNKIYALVIVFLLFTSCIFEIPESFEDDEEEGVSDIIMDNAMECILIVGQSNASGYAPSGSSPNWFSSNNFKVNGYGMWNKHINRFQEYQLFLNTGSDKNDESHFGFDIFFARKYNQTYNKQLLAIKQTLGGTPISEKGSSRPGRWTVNTSLIPNGERCMVCELEEKVSLAREYASSKNSKLNFIAILFHQGESDAEKERYLDYEVNFKNLILKLRSITGNDSIPIISGELIRNDGYFKEINSIFHEYEKYDAKFKVVNMSNHLTSIGDNLHYDVNAFNYMGDTMFDYYEILK